MKTNDLIEELARGLTPIERLPRPSASVAAWCAGAAIYVGLLAFGMSSLEGDSIGVGASFWIAQAAAMATAVLASAAAFTTVIPGLASRARVWATAAAVAWLATLVAASPADVDWSAVAGASHEWLCVAFIVFGGAPPMVALALMLRRGAPLRPVTTAAFAALAAATLANIGACVSLPHANGAITLTWHGGVVAASVVLAAASARLIFTWPTAQRS
jgi:hypothetical protein